MGLGSSRWRDNVQQSDGIGGLGVLLLTGLTGWHLHREVLLLLLRNRRRILTTHIVCIQIHPLYRIVSTQPLVVRITPRQGVQGILKTALPIGVTVTTTLVLSQLHLCPKTHLILLSDKEVVEVIVPESHVVQRVRAVDFI